MREEQAAKVTVAALVVLGCVFGAAACDRSKKSAEGENAVTVTGCLQKQDRALNDRYILTQLEQPAQKPETAGGTASVNSEHLREAMYSYELTGKDKDLDKMVGHQVRVTGEVTEGSTLANSPAARATDPSNTADADKREEVQRGPADRDIKASDLAEIKVRQVEQLAQVCGTQPATP